MTLWPKERKWLNLTRFGRAGFRLQESVNFWRLPRLHTEFVLGVQVLDGKLIKPTFIWIWTHIHICSEAATIIDLLQRPFLSIVLHHLILAQWTLYQVGPNRGAS
jgi:hypothetical protein